MHATGPLGGPESIFGIHVDFLRPSKGGYFLRKKGLECVVSVYANSENAIALKRLGREVSELAMASAQPTHRAP